MTVLYDKSSEAVIGRKHNLVHTIIRMSASEILPPTLSTPCGSKNGLREIIEEVDGILEDYPLPFHKRRIVHV